MATRKPTPKPAPKRKPALKPRPTPKPTPKPAPIPQERSLRPTPTPTPKPAPLDLVRNPNFDSAMAQQNYQNSLADFRARLLAEQNAAGTRKYIATLGTSNAMQTEGNQDFIQEDPNRRYTADMVDYIDPATGERTSRTRGVVPAPGSRFVPYRRQGISVPPPSGDIGGQGDFRAPIRTDEDKKRIYDDLMARQGQLYPPGSTMPIDPNIGMPSLMPIQTPGSGALNQGQQMQNYQNFLKQGMQNSNTLNQGAMAGFANMQPGMQVPQAGVQVPQVPQAGVQVPQPGIGQTQGPNMTGMATQQRRQNPAQRKFSTFSNKPARFF